MAHGPLVYQYCRHCWHRFVEQCWFNVLTLSINVVQYQINIVWTWFNSITTLFKLFNTSILQCWKISNQHCVEITSDILVQIIHIVDIAMLYDIELTSCRHHLNPITLFTSFTPLTSQFCKMLNQHLVKMINFGGKYWCHHLNVSLVTSKIHCDVYNVNNVVIREMGTMTTMWTRYRINFVNIGMSTIPFNNGNWTWMINKCKIVVKDQCWRDKKFMNRVKVI